MDRVSNEENITNLILLLSFISLLPDDLWISFITAESRAHLFGTTQVPNHSGGKKRKDSKAGMASYVLLLVCVCVSATEGKSERWCWETRARRSQWLSQTSHDLINAIHHIWIIRQQHGSHDQSPSVRAHTYTRAHSHPSLVLHKSIAAKKQERRVSAQSEGHRCHCVTSRTVTCWLEIGFSQWSLDDWDPFEQPVSLLQLGLHQGDFYFLMPSWLGRIRIGSNSVLLQCRVLQLPESFELHKQRWTDG